METNNTKEEPKKLNLVANIVSCFWISLFLFYVLFAVSTGQWNTYYWIPDVQLSYGFLVVVATFLLSVIKYHETWTK